ncbi:MAG: hypothetical protein E7031_02580 [Akkermansiaceae bacterium]|nr:hypothetical protein [Akkermansiaceae bacterium]
MSKQAVSPRGKNCIAANLRSGEKLYWCGTCGNLPRGAKSMLLILNATLCAISVVAAWVLWRHTQSVTGGILLLLPMCAVAWWSFCKVCARGHKIYMLTNHRVAWLNSAADDVVSLPLTQNMVRRVMMKPSAAGDIIFATPADDESAVFYNVPNVRAVVRLINDLSADR